MQHIKLRTEYNFRKSYGKLDDVIKAAGTEYVGICDQGTWGYVAWQRACLKAGVKPVFGLELLVVADATDTTKKTNGNKMTFIAKNQQGIKDLYTLNTHAFKNFYYTSRIDYKILNELDTKNLFVLSGGKPLIEEIHSIKNLYLEVSPGSVAWNRRVIDISEKYDIPLVAVCDNAFPTMDDEICAKIINDYTYTTAQHICSEWELRSILDDIPESAFTVSDEICKSIEICQLPIASNLIVEKEMDLESKCQSGLSKRGLGGEKIYRERLKRELSVIKRKGFEDYFHLVADMVDEAKRTMLVGPGRGSSSGSLVCFVLGITDIDPIKYDLIFERFVDITREDLPDIDIDFPDIRRQEVIQNLKDKYGESHVAQIGTISRYKPKSAIDDLCRSINVPPWEVKTFKDSILERAPGDDRFNKCIEDAFETEIGKENLEKYPGLKYAAQMEGHARHSGVHAAGIIVLSEPVSNFCTVNNDGVAQINKDDAEDINILKLDVLGLRTLAVIENCLQQIGIDRSALLELDLNDKKSLDILNAARFAGVFQFDGQTMQQITREMPVESFDDVVALTTIARPGPLDSGGTSKFIKRRTGKEPVKYIDRALKPFVENTYGIIIFQEQVMQICREIGGLSWPDVTKVRKAMGKSQGSDAFAKYEKKFLAGANKVMDEKSAKKIWDNMCTFGAYAFNKSHAVAYATISFWCCWLKANHPLEYAAACLQSNMTNDKMIFLLRDLINEGYEYVAFDKDKSMEQWTIQDGILIGALTGAHGCGASMAASIVEKRQSGKKLLPSEEKILNEPVVSYADVFEIKNKFGDYYENPEKYDILSMDISTIDKVVENGDYIVIGKVKDIILKDLNDHSYLKKRNGRVMKNCNKFLQIKIEDDTGEISCMVGRFDYPKIGIKLYDGLEKGDFLLAKGYMKLPYRSINIKQWRKL